MKNLSEFLAKFITNKEDFNKEEYKEMLEFNHQVMKNGIQAYKKHLQQDDPETVEWAEIEKQLINALDKMESKKHSDVYAEALGTPEDQMNEASRQDFTPKETIICNNCGSSIFINIRRK
jgi:hypothetical protein